MKVSKMNSICTIIKKLSYLLIGGVSVIVLSLSSSYAYTVETVSSPLSEPVPVYENNRLKFYFVCHYTAGDSQNPEGFYLFEFDVSFPSAPSTLEIRAPNYNDFAVRADVRPSSIVRTAYNVADGSLSSSINVNHVSVSGGVYTCYLSAGNFPRSTCDYGYFISPDSVTLYNPLARYNEASFVTWSIAPPEHNVYHSQLSEPVADEYNSYFVCNDRLYWLSYRANGLYSFVNNFELHSELYGESVSTQSSGQGTYVGQANGYTSEPVSISDGSFAGVGTGGTPVVGVYSGFDIGQISYVGVNQGQLRFASDGTFTYNDFEVYPVSLSGQYLNRLFDVIIYLTDNTGFKVWLCPRQDLGSRLVLSADLYCSSFDLATGDYVSSTFSSYTGSYDHAGFDFPLTDKISDVHCYGCAFYNVNNIPVNLSDVIWEYDLEFVQWRESMLSKLSDIYNLLSQSSSIPETTTSSFGSSVEGLSDPSYSEVSPEQVADNLNDAWAQNPDIQQNSGFVKGWISEFSIPKIIALCILALASGTVILTLGKNKADT